LPEGGEMGGQKIRFEEVFHDANIVVAMTEYYNRVFNFFDGGSMKRVYLFLIS
jgi:hypothetical protein